MFELKAPESFWWDVEIPLPGGETATIHTKYRYMPKSKMDELSAEVPMVGGELAERVILDWDGVFDGDGEPMAYSPDNLARLSDMFPGAPMGFWLGYVTGMAGARRKN